MNSSVKSLVPSLIVGFAGAAAATPAPTVRATTSVAAIAARMPCRLCVRINIPPLLVESRSSAGPGLRQGPDRRVVSRLRGAPAKAAGREQALDDPEDPVDEQREEGDAHRRPEHAVEPVGRLVDDDRPEAAAADGARDGGRRDDEDGGDA